MYLCPRPTAQHRSLPRHRSCPGQAALGAGREGAEGPPQWLCPPSWRRTTAASPYSCWGIHHPARDGGEQPAPGAEQGGFLCLRGQEGGDSHGQGCTPRHTTNSSSCARSPHIWPRIRAAQTDGHKTDTRMCMQGRGHRLSRGTGGGEFLMAGHGRPLCRTSWWGSGPGARARLLGSLGQRQPHGGAPALRSLPSAEKVTAAES